MVEWERIKAVRNRVYKGSCRRLKKHYTKRKCPTLTTKHDHFFKTFFWWILRRELALRFENIKKILTPKIAFRGLYLYYSASYGQFTDFKILHEGFYVTNCFRGFLLNTFKIHHILGQKRQTVLSIVGTI